MDIVLVNIKISTKIKGKTTIFELKDFVTTNPINEYGKSRLKRESNGLDYEIVKFEVKKVIGQTSY